MNRTIQLQCVALTVKGVRCRNTKTFEVSDNINAKTFTCFMHGGTEEKVDNSTSTNNKEVKMDQNLMNSDVVRTAFKFGFRLIAARIDGVQYSGMTNDGELINGTVAGYFPVSLSIIDGDFVYLSLPRIPTNPEDRAAVFAFSKRHPEVFDAKGKFRALVSSNNSVAWYEPLLNAGLIIEEKAKVMKRVTRFLAPRQLAGWFYRGTIVHGVDTMIGLEEQREVTFAIDAHVVDDVNVFRSNEQIAEINAAGITDMDDFNVKSVDGAGIITRSVYEYLVAGWIGQMFFDEKKNWQIELMAKRFNRAEVVNLTYLSENGMLKGNFRIVPDSFMVKTCAKLGIDNVAVLTSLEGFKGGVTAPKGRVYLAVEPQEWHSSARADLQSFINLKEVMFPNGVSQMLADLYTGLVDSIDKGTLVQTPKELQDIEIRFRNEHDQVMEDIVGSWSALEWVASGLDLRDSYTLTREAVRGVLKGTVRWTTGRDGKKVMDRFPNISIPAAWGMQMVALTAARMMGFRVKNIERGEARVWWDAHMIVVNDLDFVENYENHGGSDFDDFYRVMFRTVAETGEKVIVLYRSPNGWGEYSVFSYHDGDNFATTKLRSGEVIEFPKFSLSHLPKQYTQALRDGDTSTAIDLLEAANENATHHYSGGTIGEAFRLQRILSLETRRVTAGVMVNAVMWWNHVVKDFIPLNLGTMEAYVDLTTQDDLSPEAETMLLTFASLIINMAPIVGGPVDNWFLEHRRPVTNSALTIPDSKGVTRSMNLSKEWNEVWNVFAVPSRDGKPRLRANPKNTIDGEFTKIQEALRLIDTTITKKLDNMRTRGRMPGDIIVDVDTEFPITDIEEVNTALRGHTIRNMRTRAELMAVKHRSRFFEIGNKYGLVNDQGRTVGSKFTKEHWDEMWSEPAEGMDMTILEAVKFRTILGRNTRGVENGLLLKRDENGLPMERTEEARAAWLIALAVADTTIARGPKGSPYYTDAMVADRRMVRYYLEALRFFGLADDPHYVED